jgi:aldehyde dehydrogenase (NAD+)
MRKVFVSPNEMTDNQAPPKAEVKLLAGVYVDGQLTDGRGDRIFHHVNPSTGEVQKQFRFASDGDIAEAIASSKKAFEQWKRTTPLERRKHLNAVARILREYATELAAVYALEVGAPVSFGKWIVEDAALWFEYYAGWTDKVVGDTFPSAFDKEFVLTIREPVGIVADILSWANPLANIAMSVPAALAAGCSVIVKPAEQAPFTAVRFAQLCTEAGLPAGVVNVVVGDGVTGDALVRHPSVAKVSFTGGPQTARKIKQAASQNLTPLVLELGGKSANIIFADADLRAAVDFSTIITALSGQGCSIPTRLLVEESVADEVVNLLKVRLEGVRVGDPFDENTDMGPLINETSCNRIIGMLHEARSTGAARCILGGERLGGKWAGGYFIGPTLLIDVDPDSSIAQTEIFGPVLCVFKFKSEDEALKIANGTRFGLAAFVHTSNVSRVFRFIRELSAGGVGVNGKMLPSSYAAPFGGLGLSGDGRQGAREGIDEFLYVKSVAIKF